MPQGVPSTTSCVDVQGVSISTTSSMDVLGAVQPFPTVSSVDVQGFSLSTASIVGVPRVFLSGAHCLQVDVQGVSLSNFRSVEVHAGCILYITSCADEGCIPL